MVEMTREERWERIRSFCDCGRFNAEMTEVSCLPHYPPKYPIMAKEADNAPICSSEHCIKCRVIEQTDELDMRSLIRKLFKEKDKLQQDVDIIKDALVNLLQASDSKSAADHLFEFIVNKKGNEVLDEEHTKAFDEYYWKYYTDKLSIVKKLQDKQND